MRFSERVRAAAVGLPSGVSNRVAVIVVAGVLTSSVPAGAAISAPTVAQEQLPAAVRVRVVSAVDDRPLPGVWVRAAELAVPAVTDATGTALLTGLPPGLHRLVARAPGYHPAAVRVEAVNGRTETVTLTLSPDPAALPELVVVARRDSLREEGLVLRPADAGPTVRDLGDLLEAAPGVVVERRGGPGASRRIRIRGSGSDQVLVLLDGVALNSPLTGEADLSRVDYGQVERVIVLPGARSARYGGGALAGVILVETGRPPRGDGSAALTAGSLGERAVTLRGSVAPASDLSLDGGATWSRADGDFDYAVPDVRGGGTAVRSNADYRAVSGHLRATWQPRDVEVGLRLHGRHAERGSPGTVVQPSVTGRQEQRRSGMTATAEGGGAPAGWSGTFAIQRHDAGFRDPDPPFGPAYDEDVRVRQLDLRGEGWGRLGGIDLRGGADARTRTVRATSLRPDAPERIDEAGLWAEARTRRPVGANARLRGSAQLRADVHELVSGVSLSPRVTAALEIGVSDGAPHAPGRTTIEVSIGDAFSAPGLSDLFFQEGVLAEANPELAPERVRRELTVSLSRTFGLAGAGGSASAAAYRADVEGMILWFPDHRFVWSPDNFDVRRRGVEGSFDLRWPGTGARLAGRAAWNDVTYDGKALSGQVVYRPTVTAGLDWSAPLGPVEAAGSVRYVGRRRSVPGSELNALKPYRLVDLGLSTEVDLGPLSGRVEVAVDNLLDADATMLVDYPVPGRTWSVRLDVDSSR